MSDVATAIHPPQSDRTRWLALYVLWGYHLAYLVGAALVIIAITVALTVLSPGAVSNNREEEAEIGPEPDGAEFAYGEAA